MQNDLPSADELASLPSTILVAGWWMKADIHRVEWHGRPLVIKTFRRKSALVRWLGRLQIGREARAYRAVGTLAGIPELVGVPDPWTLLIEFVEGERLTQVRLRPGSHRVYVEQLERIVGAIHERGVVHLDLRGRDNWLVAADRTVHLIDFAAAQVYAEGTWSRRWIFPRLRSIDRSAVLKWKQLLTPEDLSEREHGKLRRYRRWRRLWFFNRKELGASDRAAAEQARRR